MKHALLAAVAVAALAFPGLAATATNKTHAPTAARAAQAKALPRPVHQMLGAQLPWIKTGPGVQQGYVLSHNRSPRGSLGAIGAAVPPPNSGDNLTYGNSPDQVPPKALAGLDTVMTSNTNYAIFWIPSGYRTASNYISTISQFFNDVANDSWSNTNFDSPSVQYMGAHDGEIYYYSQWGGYAIDTNPFPKSACMGSYSAFASTAGLSSGHLAMQGLTNCLSDQQIQAEVKKFADAQGWDHGGNTEFFLYTPHNVGSCFSSDAQIGAKHLLDNACSYDYYCAYHSEFGTTPSTEYIYANMPWPNQAFKIGNGNLYKTDCDGGEHPNGTGSSANGTDPNGPTDLDAADEVIGVTSHEHQESVTDPTGYGWWDDNPDSAYAGYENGDLCAWHWASDGSNYLGYAANNSFYTNVINGHKYFTQGEWSNADATGTSWSGCVWGYTMSSPSYSGGNTLTAPDGPVGAGTTLTLTAGDFTGTSGVYTYVWLSCSADAFSMISGRHLAMPSLKQLEAKNFTMGNGCNLAALDFSNSATTDHYTTTASDVSNVIAGLVYKDNGSGEGDGGFAGDMSPTQILVTGEPESNEDTQLSPTSSLIPGSKLTFNLGTWTNTPTSFSVQWQHCYPGMPESCTTFKTVKVTPAKTGTTSTTYTLGNTDVHWAINAIVTASNKAGTSNYPQSGMTDEVGGYPVPGTGENAPFWTSNSPVVGTADTINLQKTQWTVPTGAAITGWSITINRCPLLMGPDYADCELVSSQTAPASATTISYTPTTLDVGQTLVAYLVPKNKFGTANPYSVWTSNTVGGNPVNTTAPSWTETTAAHGDTVHLNMGVWSPAATQYRYAVYACTDPVDTTTCQKLTTLRVAAADPTTVTWSVNDFGQEYYLRASVQAINVNGYSNDASWSSNAVDVDHPAGP